MNRTQLEDGIEQEMNLTYDLAEGHNVTLKGSMNASELPEGLGDLFLSLMQQEDGGSMAGNIGKDNKAKQLDTNVMYDPLSGEGLVCVNGRCISNKRKF